MTHDGAVAVWPVPVVGVGLVLVRLRLDVVSYHDLDQRPLVFCPGQKKTGWVVPGHKCNSES